MLFTKHAIQYPKKSIFAIVLLTLLMMAFVPMIKIDTDPENMLSENEEVRQVHTKLKNKFQVHDMIVLGIVNEKNPNGIFNKSSLEKIYKLSESIGEMQSPLDKNDVAEVESGFKYEGVIKKDLMAPNFLDHIQPLGNGSLQFDWLMSGRGLSYDGTSSCRRYIWHRNVHPNGHLRSCGHGSDFLLDVVLFQKTQTGFQSIDCSHDFGTLHYGTVDSYGQYGSHHEFYDTDIYHAHCRLGLCAYSVRVL